MGKKVTSTFTASIIKNQEKGGAWLANITLKDEGIDTPYDGYMAAWANASAAKRWIKDVVQKTTPRKSVKMLPTAEVDAKNKPVMFTGQVTFKREV